MKISGNFTWSQFKDFYRQGWRPTLGWGISFVVISAGFYEFVFRHFLAMGGNDVGQLVAYLTAALTIAGIREWGKSKGNDV